MPQRTIQDSYSRISQVELKSARHSGARLLSSDPAGVLKRARKLAHRGALDEAKDLLSDLLCEDIRNKEATAELIRVLGKMGSIESAESVFQGALDDGFLDDSICARMISAYRRMSGEWSENRIVDAAKRVLDLSIANSPGPWSFVAMMKIHGHMNRSWEARKLFNDAQEKYGLFHPSFYSTMILVYSGTSELRSAKWVYHRARELDGADHSVYGAMLEALIVRRMTNHAQSIYGDGLKSGMIEPWMTERLIEGYVRNGQMDEAENLFLGSLGNGTATRRSFAIIARSHLAANAPGRIASLGERTGIDNADMIPAGFIQYLPEQMRDSPLVLLSKARYLVARKDMEGAIANLSRIAHMGTEDPRVMIGVLLLRGRLLMDEGRYEDAFTLFNRLLKASPPDSSSFNEMAFCIARANLALGGEGRLSDESKAYLLHSLDADSAPFHEKAMVAETIRMLRSGSGSAVMTSLDQKMIRIGLLIRSARHQEALEETGRIMAENPGPGAHALSERQMAQLLMHRAEALAGCQEHERAASILGSLMRSEPPLPPSFIQKARRTFLDSWKSSGYSIDPDRSTLDALTAHSSDLLGKGLLSGSEVKTMQDAVRCRGALRPLSRGDGDSASSEIAKLMRSSDSGDPHEKASLLSLSAFTLLMSGRSGEALSRFSRLLSMSTADWHQRPWIAFGFWQAWSSMKPPKTE